VVTVRFRPSRCINPSSPGAAKRVRSTTTQRPHVEVASAEGDPGIRVVTQADRVLRRPVQDRGPVGRPYGEDRRRSYMVRVENGVTWCYVSLPGSQLRRRRLQRAESFHCVPYWRYAVSYRCIVVVVVVVLVAAAVAAAATILFIP